MIGNYKRVTEVLRNTRFSFVLWGCLLILFIDCEGWTAGLASRLPSVVIEGVVPGGKYRVSKVVGKKFDIYNLSQDTVTVRFMVVVPQSIKAGYEPVTDTSWVKVSTTALTVLPGKSGGTEIELNVPDEEAYLGKKMQVNVWGYASRKNSVVALGLTTKVFLNFAQKNKK
ncbi:MAG: hypothetical protein WC955_03715 [Elusimicrobiota bacterium]